MNDLWLIAKILRGKIFHGRWHLLTAFEPFTWISASSDRTLGMAAEIWNVRTMLRV
jgi:hypothetical protein